MNRAITLFVGASLFALVAGAVEVQKFESSVGETCARADL